MPKITKKLVESITPELKRQLIYWDSELKGFGIIVLPSGRRTYCVQYRNTSRVKRRLKIGVHGQITAEEARALAKTYLGKVAHGEDPAEKKKDMKNLPTFKDLANDYLERHAQRKRPKSLREDRRFLGTLMPILGEKKVVNISRREIENIHLKFENIPYQANRILALLSKMFSLAIAWGWVSDNPIKGIERYQEEKRDRWLDQEELSRFWNILDAYPTNYTALAFKFLLLTGARKNEALQATWDQFDLENGIWTKPSHLTKQKKKEHLPLSKEALQVLHTLLALKKSESLYVFPGRVAGQPIQEVKTLWKKILKKAKLEDVRIHDLRHTHASHLVSSGLSLSIVGKLLGHTQVSTTQRYAHLADEPLRQAASLFGDKIAKLTSIEP